MNDMASAIVPKSDQLNSDDLIAGPITIKITNVKIKSGEQPVSIFYEGDNGKPYKCCKSMARILVSAWGADASKYAGRSLTLYRDPAVTWAGMAVGGIRISHMSDIDSSMTMALTVTRANKKPFTVKPLALQKPKAAARESTQTGMPPPPSTDAPDAAAPNAAPQSHAIGEACSDATAVAAPCITPEEALILEARCTDNGIPVGKLKSAAKVERLSQISICDLARSHAWIDAVLAKREAK